MVIYIQLLTTLLKLNMYCIVWLTLHSTVNNFAQICIVWLTNSINNDNDEISLRNLPCLAIISLQIFACSVCPSSPKLFSFISLNLLSSKGTVNTCSNKSSNDWKIFCFFNHGTNALTNLTKNFFYWCKILWYLND